MKLLSKQAFETATRYIKQNADPINLAWYSYNFEGMSTDAFMDVLAKYQYDNGGFGGLVYEYEYNGPMLHDTEHAFRYIFYLKEKPSAEHPVILKMMQYVLERYLPGLGCWGELLEPEVNHFAHVPWWGYEGNETTNIENEDERIKTYSANGHASFAAFVALYSELVPQELYKDIIKYPAEKILRYYDENSPLFRQSRTDQSHIDEISVPYNMKCFQHFVACLKDTPLADKLSAILRQHPTECMQLDYGKWEDGYEQLPCDIVSTPDSVIYSAVKDLVDESLSYLIRQIKEDGAWHLTWRFGEDEAFRKLERQYKMHLTMLILAELNRFGRIER